MILLCAQDVFPMYPSVPVVVKCSDSSAAVSQQWFYNLTASQITLQVSVNGVCYCACMAMQENSLLVQINVFLETQMFQIHTYFLFAVEVPVFML